MEQLKIFNTEELYKNSYDSLRVNTVSKTIDNKKVWFKPRNKITAYYNVTNTSSATRILGADFDTSQIRYMVVDGVKVYPTYYDETEEQVIESYNMEEQSYATMSLNLDDDDMDYRQHIASPNEGYGEIMTTMALNNDVETYAGNITPTPDYNSRKNSLGYSENEEVIDQIGVFGKYEAKYTSYIDTTYKFDSVGEHVIEFVFKASHNEINHMFNRVNSCIKVNLNRLNGKYMYYNGGMVQTFDNNTAITEIIGLDTLDVSNVFSLVCCFQATHSLKELPISNWDVRNVERMSWCFNERKMTTPLDLSGWNTENCKQMVGLFANGENYEIIFPDNFGSACETFKQMFYYSKITSIDLRKFNTSNCKDMSQMFKECRKITTILLSDNFGSSCETFEEIFHWCENLKNIDFTKLNTSNVKIMKLSFVGCHKLIDHNFNLLNVSNVENMYNMFSNLYITEENKILDLSGWDVSNVTDMGEMFVNYFPEKTTHPLTINCSNWNTSKVTNMYLMFKFVYFNDIIGIENWDVSNVKSFHGMFANSKSTLDTINLTKWDVSNAEDISYMFCYTNWLKTIDLLNWKLDKCIGFRDVFIGCGALRNIDLSSFNFSNDGYVNCYEMVNRCGNLDYAIMNGSDLSGCDSFSGFYWSTPLTRLYMTSIPYEGSDYVNWNYTYGNMTPAVLYCNPNYYYGHFLSVSNTESRWSIRTIPTEVSLLIKLYDSSIGDYMNDKVIYLNQDIYEEVNYSIINTTHYDNKSLNNNGQEIDSEGYLLTDYIPINEIDESITLRLYGGYLCTYDSNFNKRKFYSHIYAENNHGTLSYFKTDVNDKYIRIAVDKIRMNDSYVCNDTINTYYFKGKDTFNRTYSNFINTIVLTSHYNNDLGGYNFNFIAYDNKYTIYDMNSNISIGNIFTYLKEQTIIYGNVNDINYDLVITYKSSNSANTENLFYSSFNRNNIEIMTIDNIQIPIKHYTHKFGDINEHIVKIKFKEKPTAYDLQYMFYECSAMTSCDLSNLDTSEVTSMYRMFQGCTSLSSVTFGSNDTTNVTNIGNMFYNCSALTSVDFSTINMSNVDSMYSTFYNCSSLTSLDLTMFNNIVNINTLCYGCSKLTELKFNCDFSKVESYGNLLGNVTTNGVLYYNNSYESDNILYSLPSTWTFNPAQIINVSIELVENGSTVTDGSLHTITVADNTGTFNTETNLYDFSISVNSYNSASIKVDGVEQLNFVLVKGKTYKVFLGNTSLYDGFSIEMVYVPTTTTGPTQLFNSSFDLSQIYTMFIDGVMQTSVVSAYTFSDTNEHKVQCMTHDMTSMYYMFYNSNQLKSVKFGDSFNTSNVYTMYRAFRNCSNITEIDLSKLDLTNVETMNGLFHSCSNLKKVVLPENFGVNCIEMSYMFDYCYALDDLNYENLNMSNCNTAYYMFCGTPFETFNASIFDMTNMIVCEGMFNSMANLKSIDISGWNITNGNSCGAILSYCTSLETVIMDNAYINARELYSMFYNCTSLKEIDFSNSLGFYGDDFASFFYNCTNLKTIKGIDKLHPKAYTNYVFQNCESLTSIDLSSWDMSNVLITNSMFINCKKLTDVTIYSSLDNVSDYANMFSGVTTDGVLNYNIIHEEKILDMFVTNQKVSNFSTSWRLNPVTLEKTYVLTLITNDAYVKNATVSLNNVVGVYNESDYSYTFENIQVTSRQLPLIVDGIEVSQVDESKLVQYVYYGTNDELYTLIDFTTPTFDTSVIIENDTTYPWVYNEELGFLTSTMHEHNVVTYVTINSGIIGDATITLYQKNESESNYDYSAIFNSSNEIIYNLQNINSDNIVINVNTEDGILKFGYQKDYSYSEGTDCLGIKKIEGTKLPME